MRKPPEGLCAHLELDDGIDPRLMPRRSPGKVTNRKALQLCRQVERILTGAFAGDILRDLTIQSVVPAPDSSRLLATLAYHGPVSTPTAQILTSLHLAHAGLRAEIARAIHRKKTPELKFHVMRA